jgi:ABC-type ATPase with predicted acetyltransferase domain
MNPTLSQIWMSFPAPRLRSARARLVARWFGLDVPRTNDRPESSGFQIDASELRSLIPEGPRRIVLITGPSGSGKSSLLRAIQSKAPADRCIDLNRIALPDRPIVDCLGAMPLEQVLGLLSRVGLAEAWSYLRTPEELSEGQRWRLRLAMGLSRSAAEEFPPHHLLVCDEFAAVLDRVTAAVVARSLRRAIDGSSSLSAIVVCAQDDLQQALRPDVHIRCDFGSVRIQRAIRTVSAQAATG